MYNYATNADELCLQHTYHTCTLDCKTTYTLMLQDPRRFLNEEQDPKIVEKVSDKLNGLLMNGEEMEYIAVQKKPVSPDCVVITNKRVIFCRFKNLGFSLDFQDIIWKDVSDCHMKENILGAEFLITSVKGMRYTMDYLPKIQARKLYTYVQNKEEDQKEYRRQRDLEMARANSGQITLTNTTLPTPAPTPAPVAQPAEEDPVATLQKLKSLLEHQLITQQEYDTKKAEILSRL